MIKYAEDAARWLNNAIVTHASGGAAVLVLTDENTSRLCFPVLQQLAGECADALQQITIPAGESSKNIHQLASIWEALTHAGAGRDALLLCLGGGMITDIGGFAASTYKRGIGVVHIPTTLLGMVDAAIGGKTGIDFLHFKNHIGTFYPPQQVLIFGHFLSTLPLRQLKAGFAEVLKHAIISNQPLPLMPPEPVSDDWTAIIRSSVGVKMSIVQADPTENGPRKSLNFGHTIGHALEALALANNSDLLHGEAVAAGMIAELWLSEQINGISPSLLEHYSAIYRQVFRRPPEISGLTNALIARMRHDKKNAGGQIRFALIGQNGKAVWDVPVRDQLIAESLNYLHTFSTQ